MTVRISSLLSHLDNNTLTAVLRNFLGLQTLNSSARLWDLDLVKHAYFTGKHGFSQGLSLSASPSRATFQFHQPREPRARRCYRLLYIHSTHVAHLAFENP